ncbi:Erg28-like protein [Hyaloscypha hepaticicola]|uniref:Erg28-like protein n=1 Tax=Hyaloscypha hepaticicola TaxID=2082293 RepID=A0A2J6PI84_9HELO|nr:Erg28-like protein [Hyaloscypha hepaticicola]
MSSLLSAIQSYLPQHEGLLPKWLLFVAITAFGNTIQCYTTLTFTSRVYEGPTSFPTVPNPTPTTPPSLNRQVTALSSRTFGTWSLIQAFVRLYAAYNIDNPAFYQLAYLTYAVAFGHFMSEWWYYGTCRWGKPLAGPAMVSTGTLIWMWLVWGDYVQ